MNTKDDRKSFKRKNMYETIKNKFLNLFGTFSSSDNVLIHEVLEQKHNSCENIIYGETKTYSQKKMLFDELEYDSEDSIDDNSSYKTKRARYIKNHVEESESETTITQEASNTSINMSGERNQCNPKIKSFGIDKSEEIKNVEDENVDKNNQTLDKLRKNCETVTESKNNGNGNTKSKATQENKKSINGQIKTKDMDHNQEHTEREKNCKCEIMTFQIDTNMSEVKVQSKCVNHNLQNMAHDKENATNENRYGTAELYNKTEIKRFDAKNRKLTEKKNNYDSNTIKTIDVEPTKDYSYLQILHTQSIVLEVESVLFKTVINLQNTKSSDNSRFESKMKTNLGNVQAVQMPHIFGNNEPSNILLQSVILLYNYFQQYFRNVRVIEREGLDNFLKAKAREHIIERYCSLFCTCYLKMPYHISLPNLHTDIQYATHLINTAKKLSDDRNFNEILFLEIFNSFINFLVRFQKETNNRRSNPEKTVTSQNQGASFNENKQKDLQTATLNNVEDYGIKISSGDNISKNNNKGVPQKRGRKPQQGANSPLNSNKKTQLEVAPAPSPMQYEHFIHRKANPVAQPLLNDIVPKWPSINPLQYNGTYNIHPDRDFYHNNQSAHTSYLSCRSNAISMQSKDASVPLNYAVSRTVPSVSRPQGSLDAFVQRPPPPPYSTSQQTKYYNRAQPVVLQNILRQPNESAGQNLPNFVQYDPLNEMYASKMQRTQPLASRDKDIIGAAELRYNDQLVQTPSNKINPSQTTNNNTPINFVKNAVAACFVCKRSTTRRCEGCFSIFICSKACELTILDTHTYFCKGQPI